MKRIFIVAETLNVKLLYYYQSAKRGDVIGSTAINAVLPQINQKLAREFVNHGIGDRERNFRTHHVQSTPRVLHTLLRPWINTRVKSGYCSHGELRLI